MSDDQNQLNFPLLLNLLSKLNLELKLFIKIFFSLNLISPSLRSGYVKYVESELETSPKPIKVEQVNHGAQCLCSVSN